MSILRSWQEERKVEILVHCDVAETDHLDARYFLRGIKEMPMLEKMALSQSYGKVLDLGAGAGIHSLVLQKNGLNVYAVDVSPAMCKLMHERGLHKVFCGDIHCLQGEKFDTILMLMNGIGLVRYLSQLPKFLRLLKNHLLPGGQILCDSSDISHLYREKDGSMRFPANKKYYGNISFQVESEGQLGKPFPWLYIDLTTLRHCAENCGYNVASQYSELSGEYLVKLCPKVEK